MQKNEKRTEKISKFVARHWHALSVGDLDWWRGSPLDAEADKVAIAEEVFAVEDPGSSSTEAMMATTTIGRWQRRKGGCGDFQFGRPKTMGADRGSREEKAAAIMKLNLVVVVRESAFYSASYIISVLIH